MLKKIKELRHKLYLKKFRSMPIINNQILFFSNNTKNYGCSPKYITEYILKNCPKKYILVWAISSEIEIPKEIPKEVRVVRYFSIEFMETVCRSKIIICNTRIPPYFNFKKRAGQYYIQTWHSSIRLKKIERDAVNSFDEKYIKDAKDDSKQIDTVLSGCDFSTDIFKKSFWYNGIVLKSGTPRCDIFFCKDNIYRKKVYEYYGIDINTNILLYAPTFRKEKNADLHNLNFELLHEVLCNKFGGKWIIMFRLHPNINVECNIRNEFTLDVSKYNDMQELVAASDMMITDYSSCMFDMAIAKKPCILYTPDVDEYIKDERGLYFNFDELPFSLVRTNEELADEINNFNEEKYQKRIAEFFDRIGSYEDGNACKRVVEFIEEKVYG